MFYLGAVLLFIGVIDAMMCHYLSYRFKYGWENINLSRTVSTWAFYRAYVFIIFGGLLFAANWPT